MKFAVAIFFTLAMALGAQSSVIGIGGIPGISSVVSGGWAPWGSPWAPWGASSVGLSAHVLGAGPGTYVAQTRGAVHTAALDGHLTSVANVNVAPAPGTI